MIQLHKIIQEISEIVINNNIQIPDNLLTEKFEAFRLVSIVMNTEISNNEKIQLLENSIRVDDSYGKAVILLAKIYEVENKIEESINTIESFFKKYNCYLVKLEYAGILFYLKKYDIAEKICLEVLNNKNGILQSKYLLANIKKSQKDLLSSEKYFLECIEEKPEYYNACLDLSSIYLIDKKYDKCIQLYNRIGKLHKNKIQFISNIATSYFYLEEYKKALKLYKNCYKIEKNASLSYNIYQTLKKLGKKKEAHKYFKEWENLNS